MKYIIMLSRYIYYYIYQNKFILFVYMGYKQRQRRIKKLLEEKKKILKEWVLIDADSVKPASTITF